MSNSLHPPIRPLYCDSCIGCQEIERGRRNNACPHSQFPTLCYNYWTKCRRVSLLIFSSSSPVGLEVRFQAWYSKVEVLVNHEDQRGKIRGTYIRQRFNSSINPNQMQAVEASYLFLSRAQQKRQCHASNVMQAMSSPTPRIFAQC